MLFTLPDFQWLPFAVLILLGPVLAIAVKDAAAAAAKYANRGGNAGPDYEVGVRGAGNLWATNTAASEDNYRDGVTGAINRNAFSRGVRAAGPAKYEERAATVGARRFPEGVRAAAPEWQNKTQPYLSTIAALTLPPRRPKGDPENFRRVEAVGQALRAKKLGG